MSDLQALVFSGVAVGIALAWNPLVSFIKETMAHTGPISPVPAPPAWPVQTEFSASIGALAVVRNRLVATGCLDEPAKAAIEAVTHALISGTDK